LVTRIADGKPATALSMMKDLIANTADLRGVFVSDPIMTLAVAQAVDPASDQFHRYVQRQDLRAIEKAAGRESPNPRCTSNTQNGCWWHFGLSPCPGPE
jgi:hypothetical protein